MSERPAAGAPRAGLRARARFVKGAALLLLYLLAGELLARALNGALGLAVPGGVAGMALLTLSLGLGLVELATVKEPALLLVRHMSLFFVPAGVGLMLYFDLLGKEWLPVVVAGTLSTAAVLVVVGLAQQRLGRDE